MESFEIDTGRRFETRLEQLCNKDLMGIPVEDFESIYRREFNEPVNPEDLGGYETISDFIHAEMTNTLAEIQFKGRGIFMPRARAAETINRRTESYKLVVRDIERIPKRELGKEGTNLLPISTQTMSPYSALPSSTSTLLRRPRVTTETLPSSTSTLLRQPRVTTETLPSSTSTLLQRPRVTAETQTSNTKITPSETGFDPHSGIGSIQLENGQSETGSMQLEDGQGDAHESVRSDIVEADRLPTRQKIELEQLSDSDDDEARSIMETEICAVRSASVMAFLRGGYKSPLLNVRSESAAFLRGGYKSPLLNVRSESADLETSTQDARFPSVCGSIYGLISNNGSYSHDTLNGDIEDSVLDCSGSDSGHDSPENVDFSNEPTRRNGLVSTIELKAILERLRSRTADQASRKQELVARMEQLEQEKAMLQRELEQIQIQTDDDVITITKVEIFLKRKEEAKDLDEIEKIVSKDSNAEMEFMNDLVKMNAGLVESALQNGSEIDLNQIKIPSGH